MDARGYVHVVIRPKTAEYLEVLRDQEQIKRPYNVTNDLLIQEGLELLQKKLKKA